MRHLLGAAIDPSVNSDLLYGASGGVALEVHVRAGPEQVHAVQVAALDEGVDMSQPVRGSTVVVDAGRDAVGAPWAGGRGDSRLGSVVPVLTLELPVVLSDAAVGDAEVEVRRPIALDAEVDHLPGSPDGADVLPAPSLPGWVGGSWNGAPLQAAPSVLPGGTDPLVWDGDVAAVPEDVFAFGGDPGRGISGG